MTTIPPSQTYLNAVADWRAARPEYRALLAGLKRDAPAAELAALAADAGVSADDLPELVRCRDNGRRSLTQARTLAAATKELNRLDQHINQIEGKTTAATGDEREILEGQFADALTARDRHHRGIVLPAELAAHSVAVAREAGLI